MVDILLSRYGVNAGGLYSQKNICVARPFPLRLVCSYGMMFQLEEFAVSFW
jgi:hypothetical protein